MNLEPIKRTSAPLALVLALVFAGCQDNGEIYSSEEQSSQTSETAAAPAQAPEGSASATAEPSPAGDLLSQMDSESKESMAAMGHQLPAPPEDRQTLGEDVPTVQREITGVTVTVPQSWEAVPEDQLAPMRVAQFSIPPAEGSDHGADVVAYNFGPGQGGSVLANVQRWLQQIEPEDPSANKVYQTDLQGITVTEVYSKGTLLPSTMGMGPSEPQPDSALYGIIIEGAPAGNVFLKITGDRKTIENAEPALATLAETIETAPAQE
jgi:hypothetical protein